MKTLRDTIPAESLQTIGTFTVRTVCLSQRIECSDFIVLVLVNFFGASTTIDHKLPPCHLVHAGDEVMY